MRPHLDLLKACGSKVVIWAETSGTVQGKRNVPVADRPVMSEGEWPGYLERDRPGSPTGWPRTACRWRSTITWAR